MDEPVNQFRQPVAEPFVNQTVTSRRLNRYLVPIALALGVLLIIGGITLGMNGRNRTVVSLPDFSPTLSTPEPTPTPTQTPTPTASPISPPSPSPTISSQTKKAIGSVKGAATAKPVAQVTPLSLPSPLVSPSLPAFQPVVPLPDFQPQFSQSPSLAQPIGINVKVSTPTAEYSVNVPANSTVLNTMQTASQAGLNFKTQEFSFGSFITEINGQAQGDGKFWTYKLNGVFANKGVSSQTVNNGDTVSWILSAG